MPQVPHQRLQEELEQELDEAQAEPPPQTTDLENARPSSERSILTQYGCCASVFNKIDKFLYPVFHCSRDTFRPLTKFRRTFCLISLFDSLLIIFLWIINSFKRSSDEGDLIHDIVHYSIWTSLFDVVVLGFCRFVLLFITYGLLRIKTRLVIAFTTASSTIFLTVKLFYYKFIIQAPGQSPDSLDWMLFLASFIVSWVEAWYYDFHVLNKERDMIEDYISRQSEYRPSVDFPYPAPPSTSFFTPYAEYARSEATDVDIGREDIPRQVEEEKRKQELRDLSQYAVEYVAALSNSANIWKKCKDTNGATLSSTMDSKYGRVFKLCSYLCGKIEPIRDQVFNRFEESVDWNDSLLFVKRLELVDEKTDVVHFASKKFMAVDSRDFVILRRWAPLYNAHREQTGFQMVSISCNHEQATSDSRSVRGAEGPSALIFRDIADEIDEHKNQYGFVHKYGMTTFHFTWIYNTNLNISWLPQAVLDTTLSSVMVKNLDLVKHRYLSVSGKGQQQQQQQERQDDDDTADFNKSV